MNVHGLSFSKCNFLAGKIGGLSFYCFRCSQVEFQPSDAAFSKFHHSGVLNTDILFPAADPITFALCCCKYVKYLDWIYVKGKIICIIVLLQVCSKKI